MLRRTRVLPAIALTLSTLASTEAGAAAQRTFVRSDGVDNPSCSLAAPCRGLAAAVAATLPNGEVIVLDSAGYGTVAITQAVSIVAPPGVYAGISVFTGDGVTVSAGPADKVVLRGLTINGQGGDNGIRVASGKAIHIEDCVVANMSQHGILIEGGADVIVARATVRTNGQNGVRVAPSAAISVTATLADSLITANAGAGVYVLTPFAGATARASINRVTVSNNPSSGFAAFSLGLGTVIMTVVDSVATENGGNGVFVAGANATAIVSGSSLVRSGFADLAQNPPSVLRTAGNNAVTGRGAADIAGSLTSNPLK